MFTAALLLAAVGQARLAPSPPAIKDYGPAAVTVTLTNAGPYSGTYTLPRRHVDDELNADECHEVNYWVKLTPRITLEVDIHNLFGDNSKTYILVFIDDGAADWFAVMGAAPRPQMFGSGAIPLRSYNPEYGVGSGATCSVSGM